MMGSVRRALLGHGAAALAAFVAIALRLGVEPWLHGGLPYLPTFAAVAFAVWIGGAPPAVLAALIGFFGTNALVPGHPGARGVADAAFAFAAFGYALSSTVIIAFGVSIRRAQRRCAHEAAERAAAERAASQARQQFEATLLSIGEAVVVTDLAQYVLQINGMAERLTGWRDDEARGRPLAEVLRLADAATGQPVAVPDAVSMADSVRPGAAGEAVLRPRSGAALPVEYIASPVRSADGRFHGAVIAVRDVSLQRARDAELRQALARLQALVDASPLAIIVVDPDDTVVRAWNGAATQLFGWRADEVIGRPIPIVPPGGAAESARWRAAVRNGKTLVDARATRRRKDGSAIELRLSAAPLRNDDGRIHAVLLMAADDTQSRRAARLDARLAAVFRASSEAMVSASTEGIVESWNPAAERLFGYTADEIVGYPIRELTPLDMQAEQDELQDAVLRGEHLRFETLRLAKSGRRIDVLLSLSPIRDDDDRVSGVSMLALDITAQKQAAQALAGSDQRKSDFIATLAHELRNPLAPIRHGLAILRLAVADPTARARAVSTMERQVALMVRMIDDLLDISRISRDQLELRREPVDLRSVVDDGVETSQPLIALHGHTLDLDRPDAPLVVDGDAARLTQTIANLLNNAAKYTPRGGRISVALARDGADAVVKVCDNGIGIPPDMLAKVFDMFAQVDRSATPSASGLGIGLAISRRLVEMHGGRLEAHSDGEACGSCFTLRLPLLAQAPGAGDGGARGTTAPPVRARRVLVIDDNVDAASSLCALLALLGHTAHAAHDGASGIADIARLKPDMALVDIGMPRMDGYEVARRLRATPSARRIMLVALTGWGTERDRARSAEAGFDRHLVKPVGLDELQALFAEIDAAASGGSDVEALRT